MPYVNIKITREGNVTPEQKKQLIEGATELLHRVLNKNTATTVVVNVGFGFLFLLSHPCIYVSIFYIYFIIHLHSFD